MDRMGEKIDGLIYRLSDLMSVGDDAFTLHDLRILDPSLHSALTDFTRSSDYAVAVALKTHEIDPEKQMPESLRTLAVLRSVRAQLSDMARRGDMEAQPKAHRREKQIAAKTLFGIDHWKRHAPKKQKREKYADAQPKLGGLVGGAV